MVAGDTFARDVDRDRVDDDWLKKEAMKGGDDNSQIWRVLGP